MLRHRFAPPAHAAVLACALLGSCECPPGEPAPGDERTPKTGVECYDQAYAVVRACRQRDGFATGVAIEQGCMLLLDQALDLCDRHYGRPYHGTRADPPADDTDTAAGDAL